MKDLVNHLAPKLHLPMKILIPDIFGTDGFSSVLGVGDIAIPGMFMLFAYQMDIYVSTLRVRKKDALDTAEDGAVDLAAIDEPDYELAGLVRTKGDQSNYSHSSSSTNGSLGIYFQEWPYFILTLLCYQGGLFVAFLAMMIFHTAQPALTYILPLCIIPFVCFSWYQGHLMVAWAGIPKGVDKDSSTAISSVSGMAPHVLGKASNSALGQLSCPQPPVDREDRASDMFELVSCSRMHENGVTPPQRRPVVEQPVEFTIVY